MTNTSDDLIKRLEEPVDNGRSYIADIVDGTLRDPLRMEAAARIRELEALLEAADAEIDVERHLGESDKLIAGTHVIVPVEPTQLIRSMAHDAYCDALTNRNAVSVTELIDIVYRTSIRAAKQDAD